MLKRRKVTGKVSFDLLPFAFDLLPFWALVSRFRASIVYVGKLTHSLLLAGGSGQRQCDEEQEDVESHEHTHIML